MDIEKRAMEIAMKIVNRSQIKADEIITDLEDRELDLRDKDYLLNSEDDFIHM